MARAAFRRPGQAPVIPLARMGLALSHPLRAGLRFCIVCQGGMAVDLVTGAKATVSGTLAERTMVDGRMADFDGSDYFNFPDNDTWDITGDITLFWRGIVDSDGTFFLVGKNTNDVGANSPFYFSTLAASGLDFIRTDAAGNFSFWRAATGTTANAPVSYGVTCPAVSNVSCTMYRNGAPSSATLQFSAGTATPTGNSQPLRLGRDIATTPKQLDGGISVVIGWARQLNAAQHMSIHRDPYQLIVDRGARGVRVMISGTTFNQSVTATQGSTAALLRAMGKAVNANAPDLATIGRAIGKVISLTGPSSPVIRRQAGKPIAATLGSTAAMVRQTAKGIAVAGSASPALAKAAAKTITPSASSSASVSATRAFLKTVSVNAASAVTAVRQAGKTVAAAAANAATMTRQTAKGVAATAASSPSVSATRAFLKTVSVAAGSAATITRSIAKTIAASAASLFAMVRDYISGGIAPGTAVPRTGGTVTAGGGSAGTASARPASDPATPR